VPQAGASFPPCHRVSAQRLRLLVITGTTSNPAASASWARTLGFQKRRRTVSCSTRPVVNCQVFVVVWIWAFGSYVDVVEDAFPGAVGGPGPQPFVRGLPQPVAFGQVPPVRRCAAPTGSR
jgi:hypothetical protein